MSRFVFDIALLTVALVTNAIAIASDNPPYPTGRSVEWQFYIDSHGFTFPQDTCGPFGSLVGLQCDGELHLVYDPKTPDKLKLEVHKKGWKTLSLSIGMHSSFAGGGDRLFVTEYNTSNHGCKIAAYDLKTAQLLWREKVHSKIPPGYSAYRNSVKIYYQSTPKAGKNVKDAPADTVLVVGSEGYTDYKEAFDGETGESLYIRHYRVGFGP